MVDKSFTAGTKPYPQAPTIAAPGGTIYIPGSSGIYYLNGNDWGTDRRMHFATLGAMASAFGFDTLVSNGGRGLDPRSWTRCRFGYAASARVADAVAA